MQSSRTESHSIKGIASLYVMKAICAFLVVATHSRTEEPNVLTPILAIAVPVFLYITGYLLYAGDAELSRKKCIKWAVKMLGLIIVYNTIYGFVLYFVDGVNIFTDVVRLFKFVAFGSGICGHLWYLTAVFQAFLILYVVLRYVPRLIYFLPLLSIVAYILGNLGGLPVMSLGNIEVTAASFRLTSIATALPFMAAGYVTHKHEDFLIRTISIKFWLPIIVIAGAAELVIRLFVFHNSNIFMVYTLFLIFILMLICIKYKNATVPVVGDIGRKHSGNIYYFHILVQRVFEYTDIYEWGVILESTIIYIVCLPISFIFNWVCAKWNMYVWNSVKQWISVRFS